MRACRICGRDRLRVAGVIGVCADCIRSADNTLMREIEEVHARHRSAFHLPPRPPRHPEGKQCLVCHNRCSIPPGGTGYCGVRRNLGGRICGGTAAAAPVSWYHDPLPTNCVADWVCAGGTGAGYPRWAYRAGPEHGYANLAVFYESCTFDCLFCQNWHYRERTTRGRTRSAEDLAAAVDRRTACICYFGGDPTAQLPHALAAARIARRRNPGRPLRICWETNGAMHPSLLDRMMGVSLESGGCVKFDLKAFDRRLHIALCQADNRQTLENFRRAAGRIAERPEPPPLVASTLLVRDYVDDREVAAIARFIADLDPEIPYALLAFHGDFLMSDLPPTSREQAERCLAAAREAGLRRVRLGNAHLLTNGGTS